MPDYSIVLTRSCAVCSESFTYLHSRRSNPPRRYCSEACRWAGIMRAKTMDIPCRSCGKPVRLGKRRTNVKRVVCSSSCLDALLLATRRARILSRTDQTGPCWIWCGNINPKTGYGSTRYQRKSTNVHRVAYLLFVGPIPDGLEIDHTCHNADPTCVGSEPCLHRRCINPAHLEAVSHQVNALRGNGFMARRRRDRMAKTGTVDILAVAL